MRLDEKFAIAEQKVAALLQRMQTLGILLTEIEETITRGSGRGGQKINKTSNRVCLHHLPTGLRVACQQERERNKNRFLALRLLVDKIEQQLSPHTSRLELEKAKIRKQKQRRARRQAK